MQNCELTLALCNPCWDVGVAARLPRGRTAIVPAPAGRNLDPRHRGTIDRGSALAGGSSEPRRQTSGWSVWCMHQPRHCRHSYMSHLYFAEMNEPASPNLNSHQCDRQTGPSNRHRATGILARASVQQSEAAELGLVIKSTRGFRSLVLPAAIADANNWLDARQPTHQHTMAHIDMGADVEEGRWAPHDLDRTCRELFWEAEQRLIQHKLSSQYYGFR